MLYEHTVKELVKKLADKTPIPGGGSAGALSAAMGCALGLMCMRFSDNLQKEQQELDIIANLLVENIDKDSEAYEMVAKAYKVPAKTDEEKAKRKEQIQASLKNAADVPFDGIKLIHRALEILVAAKDKINKRLISDLASACELLSCSSRILWYNVVTNINSMNDHELTMGIRDQGKQILDEIEIKSGIILEGIYEVLKP